MKKYVFLIASLSAASAWANDRDPVAIGNRLGDGAFMKATGLSSVEWAAMCNDRHQSGIGGPAQSYGYSETQRSMPERNLRDESQNSAYNRDSDSIGNRLGDGAFMKATGLSPVEWGAMTGHQMRFGVGSPAQTYGYSETERLMPDQTPRSTEILPGQSPADTSVSAGPSKDANFSATINDTTPLDSLTDSHKLDPRADISRTYSEDHSPIYTDRSDVSGLGVPASSERGTGSSSAKVVPPIDDQLSSAVSSDLEWASQFKSDLTKESPDNTSGETFTAENMRDVNIRRSNGTVTLTGSVPTESMKRELEARVGKLSGVSSINNQLRVAPSADIPASANKDNLGVYPPTRD